MPAVVRKIGITEQTYYRWRKEYGGLRTDQTKRFNALERENARLKKMVADLVSGGLESAEKTAKTKASVAE